MAALSIHEPKLVVDVVPAFFDFSSDLLPAETIVSAVCTVSVHTGTDPAPSVLLYQTVIIAGSVCEQKIQKGLPGVVYDILMTVVTSTTRTIEQVTRIAILPNPNPASPVYIPLYFTSQPYPIDITDGFAAGTSMIFGHSLINPYITEFITTSTSMNSGSLYNAVINYAMIPEDIQAFASMLDGSLYDLVITYDISSEGILAISSMLDGSLYNSQVSYTIPYEDIQASSSMLSGSIT